MPYRSGDFVPGGFLDSLRPDRPRRYKAAASHKMLHVRCRMFGGLLSGACILIFCSWKTQAAWARKECRTSVLAGGPKQLWIFSKHKACMTAMVDKRRTARAHTVSCFRSTATASPCMVVYQCLSLLWCTVVPCCNSMRRVTLAPRPQLGCANSKTL